MSKLLTCSVHSGSIRFNLILFHFYVIFYFCLFYTAHLLAHCRPFIPPVPLSSYCEGEFLLEIYKVSTYLLYVGFGSRCNPGCLVPAAAAAAVRSGGKREEGGRERVESVWVTTPWLAALLSSSIVQLWAHTRPPSSLATPSHSPPPHYSFSVTVEANTCSDTLLM